MGPEASLKLLHLSTGASIEDAYSAYTELQKEISRFHDASGEESGEGFQEDMEILTGAYESAIGYLSDPPQRLGSASEGMETGSFSDTDLQMTVDCPSTMRVESRDRDRCASQGADRDADHRTVEEAIAITTRRLNEAESELPGAQEAVNTAKKAVEKARKRVEAAKQANLNIIISAKSAKIRALLLDVEAKKVEKSAHVIAEKARERAVAARKAAEEARHLADRERQQIIRAKKSEEAATAEVICAEDKMEMEVSRLRSLEQKLLETRNCMRMFRETTVSMKPKHLSATVSGLTGAGGNSNDAEPLGPDPILTELQNVEVRDDFDGPEAVSETKAEGELQKEAGEAHERRRHPRIAYPLHGRPDFAIDSQSIPVLDLSSKGMRIGSTGKMDRRIVRGSIRLPGDEPLNLIGRVLRQDSGGIGIKLVTRIGESVLEKERRRLAG